MGARPDGGIPDIERSVDTCNSLNLTVETLRAMPKVELHCHLDGSLRPTTMLELAREINFTLPHESPEELGRAMCADQSADLEAYLTKFDITVALMQKAGAIERIAYELVEDAANDGVKYIEVRAAPHLNIHSGLALDDVMQATLRGLAQGERTFGTRARFIVCSLRQWPASTSLQAAKLAVKYKGDGVVGFDLAGGELGHSSALHTEAFLYARQHDLGVTCHAGEADGPLSIRDALHVCGAYRIGHGVRAREDSTLVQFLRDRQIPLELCPTSNVQTHAVQSYEVHPLREYYDLGLAVTINTDNRLISGVTLTEEFIRAHTVLGFNAAELSDCVLNACDATFLPFDEKTDLYNELANVLVRDWYSR